jgi:hypothetical protein
MAANLEAPIMTDETRSRFEIVQAELRKLGMILIAPLPGKYAVSLARGHKPGGDRCARVAETLDAALALGQAMAAERDQAASNSVPAKRRRRSRRMKAKSPIRRRRRARALKRQPKRHRSRIVVQP